MNKALSLALLLAAPLVASAHAGHGQDGSVHWHATDAVGYVALAVVLAVAAWAGRRK